MQACLRPEPGLPCGTIFVAVEGKVVRRREAALTILDVFDLLYFLTSSPA